MANYLFVVPPLTGHINPLLPVAADLAQRGHNIAWAGHIDVLEQHLPSSYRCYPLPVNDTSFVDENWHKVRGLESVKFFYEYFCLPMAQICLEPLERIVRDFEPDMILCDHQMIAGALVARKLGVPWVSTITTSASILKLWDVLDDWLADKIANLQRYYGMKKIISRPDFSDHACIVFSSKALVGEDRQYFDAPYHFVGPTVNQRRKPVDFPWNKLDESKRKILISLGTVSRNRSMQFYQVMMEALKETDLQVIMVAPEEFTAENAANIPDNFIVQPRVPQLELLPHMDLVVSHAGHNTVCETLSHAKPMVVAPIRDDQSVIARQVVDAGAGLSARFGKITAKSARETIFAVLEDSSFQFHAARIQRSFAPLRGSRQAVDIVESIVQKQDMALAKQSSRKSVSLVDSLLESTQEIVYANA